jgi:hypothetical protein
MPSIICVRASFFIHWAYLRSRVVYYDVNNNFDIKISGSGKWRIRSANIYVCLIYWSSHIFLAQHSHTAPYCYACSNIKSVTSTVITCYGHHVTILHTSLLSARPPHSCQVVSRWQEWIPSSLHDTLARYRHHLKTTA